MSTGKAPEARAAIVTGAARRVGRAIAEDLASNGWSVGIHYLTGAREADDLAALINEGGGRAAAVQGDLEDTAAVGAIIDRAAKSLGPLTLLVNNASVYDQDDLRTLDKDGWQRQMAINLAAPIFLTKAFVAQVPASTPANIVNLLDPRVFRPGADHLTYQVSKAGLMAATKTLARALAPDIRVNGIAPGPVVPSTHTTPDRYARRVADLPLQRPPGLAEFGQTVRYLVDTPSITGHVISLDGGQGLT